MEKLSLILLSAVMVTLVYATDIRSNSEPESEVPHVEHGV